MTLSRWIGLYVCLGWVTLVCPPSSADMLPIFGPSEFIRGTGQPAELIQTFQNCEAAAQYELVVLNGDQDGTRRVSSATISLNGAKVIGPSDFNQQVARIERPVAVLPNNRLSVRLASQPGSLLTLSVECSANCLDVRITSPVPQATINRSSTIVTGTVTSSSDEIGVTVNGVVADVQGSEFAVRLTPCSTSRRSSDCRLTTTPYPGPTAERLDQIESFEHFVTAIGASTLKVANIAA